IDAPEAWTLTTGSPSVVVAVIDTGVDINHDDLRDNIWVNPGESGLDAMGRDKRTNGIDDDRNGYVDDIHGWNFGDGDNFVYDATGHGTGVAAVLGARGNNGLHLSGVAWNVRIMPIRIITRTGIIPASTVIQALSYAARNGASICNISWLAYLDGLQRAYYEPMFKSAIGSTLVICAAGNERTNLDSLTTLFAFPPMVSHPQKITVGAIMPNGEIPDWSNVGANYVDLAAPGSQIWTVHPASGFAALDGTSFSAPFVAGTAALIQSRFPTLDASTVKERILNGVDVDLKYSGRFRKKGRLNAFNSVQ
ncbi:MAG: S8 family peptidase, partial [Planctomycetota bacterium]